MRKFISVFVILLLAVTACVGFACNEKDTEELAWPEMPPNTNPNLKYFGYYHFSSAIDEVAQMGNTNIAKVDIDYPDEIEQLASKNFKLLLMIRHVFFKDGNTRPDYAERWQKAKQDIAPYMDKIIGFYVDEPIWTGKTQEAFHLACQTVRNDFPDKRMVAILAYGSVAKIATDVDPREYCRYCTDVGFDMYLSWDKDKFMKIINKLEENVLTEVQSIWLVPKAFYVADPNKDINHMFENKYLPPGEDIKRWIKGTYEIAVNDPRIVGLFCFKYGDDDALDDFDYMLYQFFDEDGEYYDAELKGLYMQIGKAIIANDK
jgi:hypothetical protein